MSQAVFSPFLLLILSASTLCLELALNICGFCDRVPAWVDLEDLVKVRSAKHLLHLIKSKLLHLITDGLWGMAGSYKSTGRRLEGPEGVMYKWSLLKIEHSEASEVKPLSLTAGRILTIKL